MECQFCLVVNEDFKRLSRKQQLVVGTNMVFATCTHVGHKLLARNPDLLRQCCTEHHDLLMVRRRAEDFLDIAAHVCCRRGGTLQW